MPDDSLRKPGGEPDPEEKLRNLFDEIEREVGNPPPPPDAAPLDLPSPEEPMLPSETVKVSDILANTGGADLSPDEQRLYQLEHEIEVARAEHSKQASEIKDEFDERFQGLEGRLQKMKEEREGKQARDQVFMQSSAADSRGLGIGLSIAYTFIGMPLVGAGLGWFIDKETGSNSWLGVCTVIGVVFGLVYAMVLMKRSNAK